MKVQYKSLDHMKSRTEFMGLRTQTKGLDRKCDW